MPKRLNLFLFSCLLMHISLAQKPTISASPNWLVTIHPDYSKKPVEKEISAGYYLELSDLQINVPKQTEYRHIIRKITNENGVQSASEVSVSFSPVFQRIVFHQINVIRNGQIVNQFSVNQIKLVQEETESENYQYNSEKRAFVVLEDIRKGDQIDFAYSVIGFNPVFKNKFHRTHYFYYGTPILNYFFEVLNNEQEKLNLHVFNKAADPVVTKENNLTIYQWAQPVLKNFTSTNGAPSWYDQYPYITLTAYNNWHEVAAWAFDLFNKYGYSLSPAIQKKVIELQLLAKGDKDLFAELAIKYVQDQVRYLGFEDGSYSHQPHEPSLVFRQAFGDCKDKSLLLVSMLKQADIKAYIAILNTAIRDKINEEAPSPDVFDHAIVAIERSKEYVFIDPTISHQRGDLISLYVPAYGKALVIKENTAEFSNVTKGGENNTSIEELLTVQFPKKGKSILQVTTVYTGGAADNMRDYFAENSFTDIVPIYEAYYKDVYDSIKLDKEISIKDDTAGNKLTVEEQYSIPEIWSTGDDGRKEMSIFAKGIFEKLSNLKNHTDGAPLSLQYPTDVRYKLKIIMPQTWEFPINPITIANASYDFVYSPAFSDNEIVLDYKYKTHRDHIPADELSVFKTDYKKIEKILEFTLFQNDPAGSQATSKPSNQKIYFPTLLLFILISALIFFFFRRHNKKSVDVEVDRLFTEKMNGFTILLGITLVVSCFMQLYALIAGGYFSYTSYVNLKTYQNNNLYNVWVLELIFGSLWLGMVSIAMYWFYRQRDIFPEFFILYALAIVGGNLVLLTCYNLMNIQEFVKNSMSESIRDLARSIFYAVIWISYVKRSENVKRCFVNKYEEN
jgi:Domain of Unknown Function with PDB structure (DUF3857)/Protein of unknown function (DUF2569)